MGVITWWNNINESRSRKKSQRIPDGLADFQAAIEHNVTHFMIVGIDANTTQRASAMCEAIRNRREEGTWAGYSAGIHPGNAEKKFNDFEYIQRVVTDGLLEPQKPQRQRIRYEPAPTKDLRVVRKPCAIGEFGLD